MSRERFHQLPVPNDLIVLDGPMPSIMGGILYQVTLPSGMIITNPNGFGNGLSQPLEVAPVVTSDGRVLMVGRPQVNPVAPE
jgi:hypothetical protein